MSADPAVPIPVPTSPTQAVAQSAARRLKAVEDRLDALEKNPPPIPVTTGAPAGAAPRAGAAVVDDGAPAGTIRLGLYVPTRGGFKWVTLT